MALITVQLRVSVPDHATEDEVGDYVEQYFGEAGSMSTENACINNSEVHDCDWEYE